MTKHLQDFFSCVMANGIDEHTPREEERYIRFTNLESILTVTGVTFYVAYSLYAGQFLLSLSQGIITFFVLGVLWLNFKRHYKAARMLFLLSLNAVIMLNACFIGHASGVHEFYYISYTIPFLLFHVRDYKYIIAGVLIAVVGFNLYQQIHPAFVAYNMDLATQMRVFQINTWVIFILFGSAVYMLTYYNYQTEEKLAATNKRLNEQAIELKRSNEDLEQFGYIISHDLKAPVRNISSFMNLLSRQFGDASPKGAKEFIDMSKMSADRLTKQIDDMLSYCRVDRNLPPMQAVDLNQMVRTIQMELNEKIKEKNAIITVKKSLPVLDEVHSSMLHHVFQNLIANGIKFNTNASPEVSVDYKHEHGVFTFSVSDNGIGIDAAYKSKLFQMFKRLHTADQFEGTGIGLAVCKKIINYYNGEIWFEGEPGKGTTFYFTLQKPVADVAPNQTPSIHQQISVVLKAA
ncbi:MAG TPA: ATP-binding protein [Chitinophagales bacterium]|nr:ATP-binding protein [Chitinophagales bacterium]